LCCCEALQWTHNALPCVYETRRAIALCLQALVSGRESSLEVSHSVENQSHSVLLINVCAHSHIPLKLYDDNEIIHLP